MADLVFEIDFITGAARLSRPSAREQPEWPPRPDRVFSALVASWAARGQRPEETAALEWLETQAPPVIIASAKEDRTAPEVYVPPNDQAHVNFAVSQGHPTSRQPRQFPMVRPHRPRIYYHWPDCGCRPEHFRALAALVRDVAYVGHSASLTRCVVADRPPAETDEDDSDWSKDWPVEGWVTKGRLARLAADFAASRRPTPTPPRPRPPAASAAGAQTIFSDEDWIIFEDAGGRVPALTDFAVVAQTARNALMKLCPVQPPPEILSGHSPDGSPTRHPHLAIWPLADVGWDYSEGRLMGLAFVLPRLEAGNTQQGKDRQCVLETIYRFSRREEGEGDPRAFLTLYGSPPACWFLQATGNPERHSLRPSRYINRRPADDDRSGCRWATVTPIALDRHPKKDQPGAREIIAEACRHIGLPAPVSVTLYKHSTFRGAPPARPLTGAPHWTDWSFPEKSPLKGKPLHHAVITFARPVLGPVALGAGRFRGLGLCMPLPDPKDRRDG